MKFYSYLLSQFTIFSGEFNGRSGPKVWSENPKFGLEDLFGMKNIKKECTPILSDHFEIPIIVARRKLVWFWAMNFSLCESWQKPKFNLQSSLLGIVPTVQFHVLTISVYQTVAFLKCSSRQMSKKSSIKSKV